MNYIPSLQEVLAEMEKYGGSFAMHLARAWMRADLENRAKLMQTFKGLYKNYERQSIRKVTQ